MIKHWGLVFIMLTINLAGNCQTSPQFTHYVFNSFFLNPAAAGLNNKTTIQAGLRSQYTGYTSDADLGGSVMGSVFSADLPLSKIKGGLGVYFSEQKFSKAQKDQAIQIAYSYHKKIGINTLALGISGGWVGIKLMGENYRPRDENDPFVPTKTINSYSPNLNVGAIFYAPNYQLGLSAKNLLPTKYKLSNTQISQSKRTDYILTGKLDFGVTYTLDVSPMFIVKSDFTTISTEMGMLANYNQKYWGGVNYRWQDAASLLLGGNFLQNTIKAGYALDIVTFGTTAKSPMSHEIFFRYTLNPPKLGRKSIVKTPRYSI
jgi:type IX secretion system PorP/SprF family membrane protein